MTLVELLVVLAVVTVLALMILPAINRARIGGGMTCLNNLKQIGLATRIWEGDHNDKYPAQESVTNGGSMEFIRSPNTFRHFQVLSNELSSPRVLLCPKDSARIFATNFQVLANSNISFFFGVDANETNGMMILAGDRNITNGTPIRNGILELTSNAPSGWTAELHNKFGNLALSDGSVRRQDTLHLRSTIASTGTATNRLQMPILGP